MHLCWIEAAAPLDARLRRPKKSPAGNKLTSDQIRLQLQMYRRAFTNTKMCCYCLCMAMSVSVHVIHESSEHANILVPANPLLACLPACLLVCLSSCQHTLFLQLPISLYKTPPLGTSAVQHFAHQQLKGSPIAPSSFCAAKFHRARCFVSSSTQPRG